MVPYYLGQICLFLRASRLKLVYDRLKTGQKRFSGKIMED